MVVCTETVLQAIYEGEFPIRVPRHVNPLGVNLLVALVRHDGSLPLIDRSESEAVSNIACERGYHKPYGDIERKQIFWRIPLLVKLAANHTSEVAKAIDAKHEGAFPRLRCVATKPCHGERSGNIAAE